VILKPSDFAPHGCTALAEATLAAGLPAGVFQLLHGAAAVGRALVEDPRIRAVSFTGGLQGGRSVALACMRQMKVVQLELGGNNPLVVLDDADLDAAADGVVAALTTLNGQWCRALGRLLVARARLAPLVERVAARLAQLRLGDSRDPVSQMGPLVHHHHRERIQAALDALARRGGRALAPTPLPSLPGCFVAPTLVSGVPPDAATDEIFGPVATVHAFDDDAEALALANGTPFGLAAYVFGAEPHALAVGRRIEAGVVKINGVTLFGLHPDAPRPAWGLSGLVDEGVEATFEHFRGGRVVGVADRRAPERHA
jgi:phenylacetaldehyde dehydrogenase